MVSFLPMFLYRTALACMVAAILNACTFQPEEEYFEKIEQGTAQYAVFLNEYSEVDTIRIYGYTQFTYSMSLSQGEFQKAEVLLDGDMIHSGGSIGYFAIDYRYLTTGYYELKLQFEATSGTGSMADNEGVEKVEVWRKWVLEIYVDLPSEPVVTAEIKDGYAIVSWTPYTGKKFLHYILTVYPQTFDQKTIVINDPAQTQWVDSSYVGGWTNYGVMVKNLVGDSGQGYGYVNFSLEPVGEFNAEDSTITVSWTTSPLAGPFKQYSIEDEGVEVAVITDRLQNSISFKPATIGLSYISTVVFSCQSKNTSYNADSRSSIDVVQNIGSRMKIRPEKLYYNEGTGKMIGYSARIGTGWLFKYDAQMLAEDSLSFDILSHSVPFHGNYAYYPEKPNVMKVNLATFESEAIVAISSPTGFASGPSAITGTSTGIVSYAFFGPNPIGSGAEFYGRVYDPTTEEFRFSDATLTSASAPVISDDGAYMKLTNNTYYKFDGTSYSSVGTITNSTFLFFRPDKPDEIVTRNGSSTSLLIYDANDLALKRTISPPEGVFTSYDPVTRKAIFCSTPGSKQVYAVDVDSGETTLINALSERWYQYTMTNGILFGDDGTYVKIFK
jgi:hypothetical protein